MYKVFGMLTGMNSFFSLEGHEMMDMVIVANQVYSAGVLRACYWKMVKDDRAGPWSDCSGRLILSFPLSALVCATLPRLPCSLSVGLANQRDMDENRRSQVISTLLQQHLHLLHLPLPDHLFQISAGLSDQSWVSVPA